MRRWCIATQKMERVNDCGQGVRRCAGCNVELVGGFVLQHPPKSKRTPIDMAAIYALHLSGGSGDIACGHCLNEAKRHHEGSVVSVALLDDPNAPCQWCGISQDEPYEVSP